MCHLTVCLRQVLLPSTGFSFSRNGTVKHAMPCFKFAQAVPARSVVTLNSVPISPDAGRRVVGLGLFAGLEFVSCPLPLLQRILITYSMVLRNVKNLSHDTASTFWGIPNRLYRLLGNSSCKADVQIECLQWCKKYFANAAQADLKRLIVAKRLLKYTRLSRLSKIEYVH